MKKLNCTYLLLCFALSAFGQSEDDVDTLNTQKIGEVTVNAQQSGKLKSSIGNVELISSKELLRAACCNLGESFTTNPSVDVNYADAATGAQQIKLLGLSGTYVQMLTENIPNYRGLAAPFSLSYIPGPWMQSIQVSKGASSVKNGYESITGQINVEFKKPQATPFADANLYYNTKGKLEANLGGNLKLSERWSTALLGHYEILDKAHDDNGDGFVDMPKVRQGSLQSRWAWMGDRYIFQASVKGLKEHLEGGQISHNSQLSSHPYIIDITNERYEAFTKNAFFLNEENMRTKVLFVALALATVCFGKDIRTVVLTTLPEMHCANCEKKIKENIRFEKGVKSIKTDLKTKTVTIEYDADKTNVQDIIKGFKKIKYEASEVKKEKEKK